MGRAPFPFSFAEKGLGDEGRANDQAPACWGAHHPPLCERRPLRKGEGWSQLQSSRLKAPPAVNREPVALEANEPLRSAQHRHPPDAELAQYLRAQAYDAADVVFLDFKRLAAQAPREHVGD